MEYMNLKLRTVPTTSWCLIDFKDRGPIWQNIDQNGTVIKEVSAIDPVSFEALRKEVEAARLCRDHLDWDSCAIIDGKHRDVAAEYDAIRKANEENVI